MAKNGFHPKPKPKAVNPIKRDVFRSDQLAQSDLAEDSKRTIKYGPKGKTVPIAGTNESFR